MIKKKAFTLIELIVAFTVMAVVLSAAMQSLQAFVQTSKKLSITRETQKDISFALLRMGDKIRSNPIDYSAFTKGECSGFAPNFAPSPKEKVCLKNGWGFLYEGSLKSLNILKNSDKSPLFPKNIEVLSATFTVTPYQDPDISSSWGKENLQRQPRVDIHLEVQSVRDPSINFEINTSFSSRVY